MGCTDNERKHERYKVSLHHVRQTPAREAPKSLDEDEGVDQGGRRWVAAAIQDAGGRPGWSRQDPLLLSSALVAPKLTFTSVSIAYAAVALCTSVCVLLPLPFLFLARGAGKNATRKKGFLHSSSSRRRTAPANECTGSAILSVPAEKCRKSCERRKEVREAGEAWWWVLCGEQGGARLGRQRPRGCE